MPASTEPLRAKRIDALRFLGAGLTAAVTLLPLLVLLVHQTLRPFSTDIDFVDEPAGWPAADPADLAGETSPASSLLRLGFAGDIMQHRAQALGDFEASYAPVRPLIESFDLAVGNLEFPVDPEQPVGPPIRSVQFNGSLDHVDALVSSGFDVLSTSNNHAFDLGIEGVTATLEVLDEHGLIAVGTGHTGAADTLETVEIGGLRIGFVAYSMPPNSYKDADGEIDYWSRDWPIHELNFADWSAEFRAEGTALFAAHARRSRAESVDLLVALVHWGNEWHFQPSPDQRRAAHDMIDAGFDLVVGGHSHVLNPPELYRGRLIAYSLGNFISDFAELETRTGAVLEVTIGMTGPDAVGVVDFAYYPVLTTRDGHVVVPLGRELTGERSEAWQLAQRIVGPAVTPFDNAAGRISAVDHSSMEIVRAEP